MKRMLVNAAQAEELRVALIQNHTLYDLIIESAGFKQTVGDISKATITTVEPSLDAVFVDYGSKRHGFLPFKEISPEYYLKPHTSDTRPDIRELLKRGQELIIQVEKEERGNKGAALTTYISLAGSYLVLMPNNPRAGGISRRIEGDDRDELRESLSHLNIPNDMGLIIRTAGLGKSGDELQWDLDVLLSHWDAITTAAKTRNAPFLVHKEGDLVTRAIRDYLRADISEVWIDDKDTFEKAVSHIKQVRPDFVDRVKLFEGQEPLFTHYKIEHQIETAYQRTVHLPSGGSLVIDHTEALVAIDINSAGSTKGGSIEQTALHTNLEAAEEIPRQLRLRDIGGLIVIDFIDMMQVKHQREVESAFQNSLKLDRARVKTTRISSLGLFELSRQRLRPSLKETIQHVCPTCNGHGSVRSVESIALTILRIIHEEATKPNTSEIEVQASSDTAIYLLNEKRNFIRKLEEQHTVNVFIIPNPNLQSHAYNIKRLRRTDSEAGDKHKTSYQHLQAPDVESTRRQHHERRQDEPAVKHIMRSHPGSSSTHETSGLIKRLWSTMFGPVDEEAFEKPAAQERKARTSEPMQRRTSDRSRQTRGSSSQGRDRERRERSDRRGERGDRRDERNERSSSRSQTRSGETRGEGRDERRPRPDRRTSDSSRRSRGRRDSDRKPTSPRDRRSNEIEATYQEHAASTEPTLQTQTPSEKQPAKQPPKRPVKSSTSTSGNSRRPRKIKDSQGNKIEPAATPVKKEEKKPQLEAFEQEQPVVKPIAPEQQPAQLGEPIVIRPEAKKEKSEKAKDTREKAKDTPEKAKDMPVKAKDTLEKAKDTPEKGNEKTNATSKTKTKK